MVEMVLECGLYRYKFLQGMHGPKSIHTSFSSPEMKMGILRQIVGILRCIVNRIRNQFSMCYSIREKGTDSFT